MKVHFNAIIMGLFSSIGYFLLKLEFGLSVVIIGCDLSFFIFDLLLAKHCFYA